MFLFTSKDQTFSRKTFGHNPYVLRLASTFGSLKQIPVWNTTLCKTHEKYCSKSIRFSFYLSPCSMVMEQVKWQYHGRNTSFIGGSKEEKLSWWFAEDYTRFSKCNKTKPKNHTTLFPFLHIFTPLWNHHFFFLFCFVLGEHQRGRGAEGKREPHVGSMPSTEPDARSVPQSWDHDQSLPSHPCAPYSS